MQQFDTVSILLVFSLYILGATMGTILGLLIYNRYQIMKVLRYTLRNRGQK